MAEPYLIYNVPQPKVIGLPEKEVIQEQGPSEQEEVKEPVMNIQIESIEGIPTSAVRPVSYDYGYIDYLTTKYKFTIEDKMSLFKYIISSVKSQMMVDAFYDEFNDKQNKGQYYLEYDVKVDDQNGEYVVKTTPKDGVIDFELGYFDYITKKYNFVIEDKINLLKYIEHSVTAQRMLNTAFIKKSEGDTSGDEGMQPTGGRKIG